MKNNSLNQWNKFSTTINYQKKPLFTCIRISHFLKANPITKTKIPAKAWEFYTTTHNNIKGISLFYNLLQNKLALRKTASIHNWETELGTTHTIAQWQSAFMEIHKASHCTKHWDLTIKITNRCHYTPYRLTKFFPDRSPLCWRNCGKAGHLLSVLA